MAYCVTFARTAPFGKLEGVDYGGPRPVFVLGVKPNRVEIELGDGTPEGMPQIKVTDIIRADPVVDGNDRIVGLVRHKSDYTVLLRIKTLELDFGAKYKPPVENFPPGLFWMGGEGVNIPFVQAGDRRGFEQDQLFALKEGDKLIAADKATNTVLFFVRGGKLRWQQAHKLDVLDHIRARAPYMDERKEVAWGFKMFYALGACDRRADPLVTQMRSFDSSFVLNWDEWAA